jgi:hypothetical protein
VIDRDVALLLIGAAFGVVSAIIGSLAQHSLSLRADKVRRKRDREEREAEKRRNSLSRGVSDGVLIVLDREGRRLGTAKLEDL